MVLASAPVSSPDNGLLGSPPGSSVSTDSTPEQLQASTQSTATQIPVTLSYVSCVPANDSRVL